MTENGPWNGPGGGGPGGGGDRPEPGGMRFQDGSTTPREPTLAERKAREQAIRRQQEAARQQAQDEERSRRKRRRILVGTGVTVGIVAVIAVGYALAQPDEEVVAQCVDDETGVVVEDANCVTPSSSSRTHYGGGVAYPLFIGVGGRQYRYHYGGTGSVGSPVIGGTTVVPRDGVRVTTPSGKTVSVSSSGSVSRGGLGSSSSGSSSGS